MTKYINVDLIKVGRFLFKIEKKMPNLFLP